MAGPLSCKGHAFVFWILFALFSSRDSRVNDSLILLGIVLGQRAPAKAFELRAHILPQGIELRLVLRKDHLPGGVLDQRAALDQW